MELWERRRELGVQTTARRRLYLDLRFWNDLCDAALGDNERPDAVSCLRRLRTAVATGTVVCPVEFNVVAEVCKQRLPSKQAATLRLIDELSRRTVIVNARERMFLECLRLVQGLLAQRTLSGPPIAEIWTRPLYVAGHDFPELPTPGGMPPQSVARLRAGFEAELWDFGFEQAIALSGGLPSNLDNSSVTAEMLNATKQDPTQQFKSYKATYWAEVRGALEAYMDVLSDISLYLFAREGGDPLTVSTDQKEKSAAQLRRILYKGARKVGLKATVPSIHVGVTLYARAQWDRRRSYKPNDVFDFAHAEAALPYCNAFATERSLAATLRSAGLADEYSCAILTDLRGIDSWLDADRDQMPNER